MSCTTRPNRLSSGHVYRSRPEPELAPAVLLRETYRQGGKIRKRTLCNLSHWPTVHVEGLRGVLKGVGVIAAGQDAFTITRPERTKRAESTVRRTKWERPDGTS